MRHARHGPAALIAASLVVAPPAPAAAGGAPASARNGGTAYGSALPRPAANPVAARLSLSPRTATAIDARPRIAFRVQQRGVEQVRARIVVVRLPRRVPVARRSLGWVKTGRRVTARWPGGAPLRRGRYLVRLHAKDSRGRVLRRSAARPGRALLVVRPPLPAPIGPPAWGMPPPAPSPAGPGVFTVAGAYDFGGPDARFGAGRPGHVHEGQDIVAAQGTPVLAPYAGTVSATRYQATGAGEYVVLDALDGRDYFFAHCVRGSTAVREGTAVSAGQRLCQVGSTGRSSGAHLHVEIWLVGWRVPGGSPIDPLPELRAWAERQ